MIFSYAIVKRLDRLCIHVIFFFFFFDLETFRFSIWKSERSRVFIRGRGGLQEVKGEEKIGRDGGKSGIDRDTCARKICRSCRGNRRKLERGRGALSC